MRSARRLRGLLPLLILSSAYGLAQGSDAELHLLLHDQNRYAAEHLSATVEFYETIVRLEDLVTSDNLDDRAEMNTVVDLVATLVFVAEARRSSAEYLLEHEEGIQELLGAAPSVQRYRTDALHVPVLGVGSIAIGILGAVALGAIALADEVEAFFDCARDTESAAAALECIVSSAPEIVGEGLQDGVRATAVSLGETAVIGVLPHGKVKTTLEVLHTGNTVAELRAFGQRRCFTEPSDGLLPSDASPVMMQFVQQVPPLADLYLGTPDVEGVLHGVPVGEWTFVVFAPDHAREVSGCVSVREGETADLGLDFTPISETSLDSDAGEVTPPEGFTVVSDEHLFEGCPGREDMETSSTSDSITFRWVSGPEEGRFVSFAWGEPYHENERINIDIRVADASFGSPSGFNLSIRVNGTGRLPPVSALPGWRREATVAVPANPDAYEIEVVWSTNAPFGYGCGPVSTVAHRFVLERR